MPQQTITNFSPGLNTLQDERWIMPNSNGEPAESPDIENMDFTSQGAIVCSTGFELVSELGGGATGGTKNLMAYEKDNTAANQYLIIAHDDDYYKVNTSSFVWTSIGDYGTAATNVGGVVFRGTTDTRRAILGNDLSANATKRWDGTTFGDCTNAPDGWIMEEWMGRLFIATDKNLYYSAVEDETNWAGGGVINFNDIITGIKAQGEFLLVFTRRDAYTVQFYYNDSFSLSTPLKKPFKSSAGCLAHKTITPVYNDTYHYSQDGIQRFGADAQFIGQNLRVNSLSWKINPSLTGEAVNSATINNACGFYFNKRFYTSLPYGATSFNSKTFVYFYDYDSWGTRTGFYPSNFAVLQDTSGMDELYFASHITPELFKFNNDYNYAGAGYTRKYKTKKFNFGTTMRHKFFNYIDVRGSMYANTEFFVDIDVDGTVTTFKINANNLERTSSGGYLGDSFYGENFYGGASTGNFKRFGARIDIPSSIKSGREIQITFRNDTADQPWKVDFLNIDYAFEDPSKVIYPFQQISVVTA